MNYNVFIVSVFKAGTKYVGVEMVSVMFSATTSLLAAMFTSADGFARSSAVPRKTLLALLYLIGTLNLLT